jgi:hypothetical protein
MVGVLRLLHGQRGEVVTGNIDVARCSRIELAGQIARKNRTVHRFVTQLDANLGAVAIDEFRRLLPADQGHVVTRHQQLGPKQ